MKKLRVLYLICILLCAHSLASGQTMSKCFRADWLQGQRIVNLTINGGKVSGTFIVRGESVASVGVYNFSGTLRSNILTVAFAGNHLPDVAPSEMKSLIWTLVKSGGRETLRIKFYGKNYQTNKYEESFAEFEPCAAVASDADASDAGDNAGYAALAKTARTIRFVRGANSASFSLKSLAEFQARSAPATFIINAAKSQSLEVRADGCVIEIYLPDRKLYQYVEWESGGEKTYATSQIDTLTIKSLPVAGNYLIVLRKPTETMRPDMLTVTVTH